MPIAHAWPRGGDSPTKVTKQFVAYNSDVEGSDIQTLSFPGVHSIKGVRIIFSSGVTNGTPVTSSRIGIGYWDGSTHRAMSVQMSDNDATPNAGLRHDTATIIQFTNPTNTTLAAEAEVSSVGAEFVKLHWSDYPTGNNLMEVTVYYGSNVSCNLHEFTGHAMAGSSLSKTGLAFAPNALEVLHVGGIAFSADAAFTTYTYGLGFGCLQADGTTELQGCVAAAGRNLPTGGVARCGQVVRSDAISQKLTIAADGTVTAGATWNITGYTADGYTVQTVGVSEALVNVVFAIRYGTGERWVGVPTVDTLTTGVKSIATAPNFLPHHVDCIATGLDATNTVTAAAVTGSLENVSIGGGRPENHCYAAYATVDGALPSSASSIADVALLRAGGAVASLNALTSTGFDIDVTNASSVTDRFSVFMAIGGAQGLAHGFGETVQISDAQVTQIQHQAVIAETVNISDAQVLLHSSLQLGETVEISDAAILLHSALLADETVEISDAQAFARSDILASETVNVSDDFVLIEQGSNDLIAVVDETVEISDAALLQIEHLFVVGETIEISDGAVLLHSALLADETVEILEQINFRGTGVGAIANETIEISDAAIAYLGEIRTVNETVEISEQVNFGEGVIPGKADSGKGGTVQGGAQLGKTYQGGARYGGTVS